MEVRMWGKELMLGEVRYLYVFFIFTWQTSFIEASPWISLAMSSSSNSSSSPPPCPHPHLPLESPLNKLNLRNFKLFGKKSLLIYTKYMYVHMYVFVLYIYRVFHNVFTSTLLMTPSVSVASSPSSRPGVIPNVCFFCYNLSQNNRITNKAHRIINDWQRSHSVHQTYRTRMSLVSSKRELINFDQRSKLVYLPFKCEFKGLPHNYTRYYSVFVDLRHRLNLRV